MKAAALTNSGIEVQYIEPAVLPENWARIRVEKVGLCGSDLAKISSNFLPSWHTRILGHEFYGQITEIKGSTEDIFVNDWVVGMPILTCGVCQPCIRGQENLCIQAQAIGKTIPGAFAEFVDIPLSNIIKITDQRSLEPYVLADVLAVCVHSVKIAGSASLPQDCLIIGDGTVGCLLAWFMHKQGYNVWIKGVHQENLKFVESMGIKVIMGNTPHERFDTVYETVGRAQPDTLNESIEAIRPGGSIVVLGVFAYEYTYQLIPRNLFIKEVRLLGSNAYVYSEFEEAVQMIRDNYQMLRSFISHRFPLSRFSDALALMKKKQKFTMKIVLEAGGISA